MNYSISLLYGSVRSDRQGIKAAKYIYNKLVERKHKVYFIDVKEYDLPMLDYMYKEYPAGKAPGDMEEIAEMLRKSDGFMVVTGEYNHSIPPALKNLLDHYQKEYLFKPSAIASYSAGSFGGVRSATHLRVILGELGTPAISSIQPFPKVQDSFDEDSKPLNERIEPSTHRFLEEFEWYLEAFKNQRDLGKEPF